MSANVFSIRRNEYADPARTKSVMVVDTARARQLKLPPKTATLKFSRIPVKGFNTSTHRHFAGNQLAG
jgi:hypothetical protein